MEIFQIRLSASLINSYLVVRYVGIFWEAILNVANLRAIELIRFLFVIVYLFLPFVVKMGSAIRLGDATASWYGRDGARTLLRKAGKVFANEC